MALARQNVQTTLRYIVIYHFNNIFIFIDFDISRLGYNFFTCWCCCANRIEAVAEEEEEGEERHGVSSGPKYDRAKIQKRVTL